jgi:hypothetical protein
VGALPRGLRRIDIIGQSGCVPPRRRLHRFRDQVECFFNQRKHLRAAATRVEEHDANHLARVTFAASRIRMRILNRCSKVAR